MPELPEVETVRRDLEQLLTGETIAWVRVFLDRTVAYPDIPQFCECLVGCQFKGWDRRGKYLLGHLDRGIRLGIHLRMTGQLLWSEATEPIPTHLRVQFGMAGGNELRFVDQRTFGQIWAVPAGMDVDQVITGLKQMGPEPFSDAFSLEYLQAALAKSQRPIKNALLDQRLVAGIGNIYADEALFLSRIHPETLCCWLSLDQIQCLHQSVIEILSTSLEQRGTSFRSYRDASGINGNYQGQAWVYGRNHQPCRRCGTPIEKLRLAGRSAHMCPTCQPASVGSHRDKEQ